MVLWYHIYTKWYYPIYTNSVEILVEPMRTVSLNQHCLMSLRLAVTYFVHPYNKRNGLDQASKTLIYLPASWGFCYIQTLIQ